MLHAVLRYNAHTLTSQIARSIYLINFIKGFIKQILYNVRSDWFPAMFASGYVTRQTLSLSYILWPDANTRGSLGELTQTFEFSHVCISLCKHGKRFIFLKYSEKNIRKISDFPFVLK